MKFNKTNCISHTHAHIKTQYFRNAKHVSLHNLEQEKEIRCRHFKLFNDTQHGAGQFFHHVIL